MKRLNFLMARLGLGVMSSLVLALGGELFRLLLLVLKFVDEREGLKLLLPVMLNLFFNAAKSQLRNVPREFIHYPQKNILWMTMYAFFHNPVLISP